MWQVLGSGGADIIRERGGEEKEQEMVKQVSKFQPVSPQISEEGNKKEDNTELEPKSLLAPGKDPAVVFSARKFPMKQKFGWTEMMHLS